jgi:hypothetical protein
MTEVTTYTTTEGKDQFYPTSLELAMLMLDGVDWNTVNTVLEPSAGKGNLVDAIGIEAFSPKKYEYRRRDGETYSDYATRKDKLDIDCVEIDPYLRSILQYQFGSERKHAVHNELPKNDYGRVTDYTPLYSFLNNSGVRVVHDDFMTYKPYKKYDLIVMNPPFAEGAEHLLKALELQQRGGGIICLLNAETLNNPYTPARKALKQQLNNYEAQIEFIADAFRDAERSANVDCVIVKIYIPEPEQRSAIFDRLEAAERIEDYVTEVTDIAIADYIGAMLRQYNIECKAGIELIREYIGLAPYILQELGDESYNNPILDLKINEYIHSRNGFSENSYVEAVRMKYWRALFKKPKFMEKLTSKLRDEWHNSVSRFIDYEFSLYNIQQIILEMNAQITKGVEDAIIALFDKLTEEHSYYPECKNTIHYYNGWKTNKAHKIGKKSIIPTYGCWDEDYTYTSFPVYGKVGGKKHIGWKLNVYNSYALLSDLEKSFAYLRNGMRETIWSCDMQFALNCAESNKMYKSVGFTYFACDFYKKGTVHIKYRYPELVDRLNIYAARKRGWLPPNYGRAKYTDMTGEEQAVVNEFHFDPDNDKAIDSQKSAEHYAGILERSDFYLAEPTKSVELLTVGAA